MANHNPNVNTSNSQRAWALAQLQAGRAITSSMADDEIGCTRLASRIDELRDSGHQIETTMIPVRNRFGKIVRVAEYRLAVGVAA